MGSTSDSVELVFARRCGSSDVTSIARYSFIATSIVREVAIVAALDPSGRSLSLRSPRYC